MCPALLSTNVTARPELGRPVAALPRRRWSVIPRSRRSGRDPAQVHGVPSTLSTRLAQRVCLKMSRNSGVQPRGQVRAVGVPGQDVEDRRRVAHQVVADPVVEHQVVGPHPAEDVPSSRPKTPPRREVPLRHSSRPAPTRDQRGPRIEVQERHRKRRGATRSVDQSKERWLSKVDIISPPRRTRSSSSPAIVELADSPSPSIRAGVLIHTQPALIGPPGCASSP